MKSRAAILTESVGRWTVRELEWESPRQDELQVRIAAAGLCHSDAHFLVGDIRAAIYPFLGGHEGAGVVEVVGPNTPGWKVGDHVVLSFMPVCGRCRWCASGMQNLCNHGARTMSGSRIDGSQRVSDGGSPVAQMCGLGTFSERVVISVDSAVKIDPAIPLDKAALVGCGVGTGWGSAVKMAEVGPGHTVVVMGVGGIGVNAVQGAVYAGASNVIAIDPVAFKRDAALEFGATHVFSDLPAAHSTIQSLTDGQGADAAIVTIGVVHGEDVGQAFAVIRKGGTVVVTSVARADELTIPISLQELTNWQKRLQGAVYGGCSPTVDIPLLLQLYQAGRLKLDELITRTYTLDEINDGYDDLLSGKNVRGIIRFD